MNIENQEEPSDYEKQELCIQHVDRLVSLGTLSAGIIHDVNNPLSYTILNLKIIEFELNELTVSSDEKKLNFLKDKVRKAQSDLQMVGNIVKSINSFSRSTKINDACKIDLQDAIDSALSIAGKEIARKSVIKKEYGNPPLVSGNATRGIQLFLNLFMNSAQAMNEAKFKSNFFNIKTSLNPQGMVEVNISDTGEGIPLEVKEKIFKPFFTTKGEGIGCGLGLDICCRIIESMKGEMIFESEVGKGTTVTLLFHPS